MLDSQGKKEVKIEADLEDEGDVQVFKYNKTAKKKKK